MPSFSTPPHRPTRDFWLDSFYYLDVTGLPTHPDSAAELAAQRAHQVDVGLQGHLRVNPNNTSDWNSGTNVGYFCDTIPDGTSSEDLWRSWTPAASSAHVHHDREHVWFSDLRQQGAHRNFLGNYTPVSSGDRHAICWCEDVDELFECIGYSPQLGPGFCQHAVTYDLTSYTMPVGANGTSNAGAIAIRVPVAPFFFVQADIDDAIASGPDADLGHMLGFVQEDYRTDAVTWPARQGDGTQETGLPAGAIIRLPSDFDLDQFSTEGAKVIARTLQRYGACLFDRSGSPRIIAPNDPDWDDSILADVGTKLDLAEFERVDISSVAGDEDSILLSTEGGPANVAPTAVGSFTPTSGAAPLDVDFDGTASTDPDGTIVSYLWDYDDGDTGTGVTATHTYTVPGTYSPTLTVTDDDGATDTVAALGSGFAPAYPLDTPDGRMRLGVSHGVEGVGTVDPKVKHEDPTGVPVMHRRFYAWSARNNIDTAVLFDSGLGRSTWASVKTPDWGDVAAGAYDADIDSLLLQLEATGVDCWLTPWHEPENDVGDPGAGTEAEWVAMLNRFAARKAAVGADRVLIVPILMAWTFNPASGRDPDDWALNPATFPVYGIDHYSYTSTANLLNGLWDNIYAWITGNGHDVAVGETGIQETAANGVAAWEAFIDFVTAPGSRVKAVCWFDSNFNSVEGGWLLEEPLLTAFHESLTSPWVYLDGLDGGGGAGGSTVVVSGEPPPAGGPEASFTRTPTIGDAPLAVDFDASASTPTDGATIFDWSWDFGDGDLGSGETTSHTYYTPGVYTVTLIVTDDTLIEGEFASASTTRSVTVSGEDAGVPTAAFTPSATTGDAPLDVDVDGSASSDPDGTIAAYDWDWGDGNSTSGVTASHTYTEPGVYTLTLTVTDDDDVTDTASVTITVTDPDAPAEGCAPCPECIGEMLPYTEGTLPDTYPAVGNTTDADQAAPGWQEPEDGSGDSAAASVTIDIPPDATSASISGTVTVVGHPAAEDPGTVGGGAVILYSESPFSIIAGTGTYQFIDFPDDTPETFTFSADLTPYIGEDIRFLVGVNTMFGDYEVYDLAIDVEVCTDGEEPPDGEIPLNVSCASPMTVYYDPPAPGGENYVPKLTGYDWADIVWSTTTDGTTVQVFATITLNENYPADRISVVVASLLNSGTIPTGTTFVDIAIPGDLFITSDDLTFAQEGFDWVAAEGSPLPAGAVITVLFTYTGPGPVIAAVISFLNGPGGVPDDPEANTFERYFLLDCAPPASPRPLYTGGQLGECKLEHYTIDLMARGGRERIDSLPDVVSTRWGRELDAVSTASIEIGKSADCCALLNNADPYATEIRVQRRGHTVWEGPLFETRERRTTMTLVARDVAHWLEVRLVRQLIDDSVTPRDACLIARDIIRLGLFYDDPNILDHLYVIEGAPPLNRKTDPVNLPYAFTELSDVARSAVDWTVIGRRIIVMPAGVPCGEAGRINDSDVLGDYEILKAGRDYASRQITAGEGSIRAYRGGRSARYGLVERVNQEQTLTSQSSVDAAADSTYAIAPRPPIWVSLDDGVRLRPTTPTTIQELVPGTMFAGVFTDRCTKIQQNMRLQRLGVVVNRSGEEVSIGAAAVGYAVQAPDVRYQNLMVVGDSLSVLNSSLQPVPLDRWADLFVRDGVAAEVKMNAVAGGTSESLRANPVYPPQAADATVVFLGANDVNTTIPELAVPLISTSDYYDNIVWFLDNYPADRQVVVYPWRWVGFPVPGGPVSEGVYIAYRDAALAASLARGAAFVDVGQVVPNAVNHVVDWIHANVAGHALLATLIGAVL